MTSKNTICLWYDGTPSTPQTSMPKHSPTALSAPSIARRATIPTASKAMS